jgi:hydroxyacylglutathione hydrolase
VQRRPVPVLHLRIDALAHERCGMILRYFYDDQLAQTSYLVGCSEAGEALAIDPARHIAPYLEAADKAGLDIVGAVETHIHADFVSGARELAERTGATLYLSDEGDADWKYQYLDDYDHVLLKDGAIIRAGNVELQARHTPGHTPEHLVFFLTDTATADQPMGIFTGDFVFVGDVGRPDLLESAAGQIGATEPSARHLFHSIQQLKGEPGYLQIWPGHGAGSACGKSLGDIPSSTLGYETLFNWAFQITDEDTFVRQVLADQPEPPTYFARMKQVNKAGPPVLHGLPRPERLPARRLPAVVESGAVVIDTRDLGTFATAHVPGTLNIPLHYDFATWSGWLVPYDTTFYLIVGDNQIDAAIQALTAIGLDDVGGYCTPDAVDAWESSGRDVASVPQLDAGSAAAMQARGDAQILDVRSSAEYNAGHIPGAVHIPVGHLPNRLAELPGNGTVIVQCGSGNRSSIAASVLQYLGVEDVANLRGGIEEWSRQGLPVG